MIPQSRIPTTPHHPPWPRSSRMLSSIRPFSCSFSPEKIPETSQSLEIRAVSPALSYPLKPAKFLFLSCTARIFPKAPSFSPPSSEHPLSCLLTQNRYGVPFPSLRPHRRRTACRPPRLFLFPFPASAGSQADGKWPFFCVPGSRLLSVYSSPPPECRPFRPLFALKTPRLPRPHLAACQSSPSLSHRLKTVSFFSKIAAFSFFSGKTTKT